MEEGGAGPGGPGGGGATHQSAGWSWSPSTPLLRRGPRRGRHQGPGTSSCPRLPRSGRPQVNTRLVFTGILGASRPDSSRARRAPVAPSAASIKPCTGKTHASLTHVGVQMLTGVSRGRCSLRGHLAPEAAARHSEGRPRGAHKYKHPGGWGDGVPPARSVGIEGGWAARGPGWWLAPV